MGEAGAKRTHTVERVVEAVRERDVDKYPVVTTTALAEFYNGSRPILKERLEEAVEQDLLRSTIVGQSTVYWPADERMVPTATNDAAVLEQLHGREADRVAQELLDSAEEVRRVFARIEADVEGDDSGEDDGPGEPQDDRTDQPSHQEDVIADGGLAPAGQLLVDWVGLSPRSTQERDAVTAAAGHLIRAGATALVVILAVLVGVVLTGAEGAPGWFETAGGLAILYAFVAFSLGVARVSLLALGWYSPDTDQAPAVE